MTMQNTKAELVKMVEDLKAEKLKLMVKVSLLTLGVYNTTGGLILKRSYR
eukprot:SAG31_NODE_1345_length_8699_cov_7.525116_2_plen_50_part_00